MRTLDLFAGIGGFSLAAHWDEVGEISGGTLLPKKKNKAERAKRLKALGNAIVPQVAYEIFRAIQQLEEIYWQRRAHLYRQGDGGGV